MSSDIFQRAAETLERESRLLDRDYDALQVAEPLPVSAPLPDTLDDLQLANESFDPRRVRPGAPTQLMKRLLHRILAVYTNGQVAFNSSAIRVVNTLDAGVRRLHVDLDELAAALDRRTAARFELTEERRILWESRFSGRSQDLEDRVFALEAELAETLAKREADQRRIEEMEEAIRDLRKAGKGLRRLPGRSSSAAR